MFYCIILYIYQKKALKPFDAFCGGCYIFDHVFLLKCVCLFVYLFSKLLFYNQIMILHLDS